MAVLLTEAGEQLNTEAVDDLVTEDHVPVTPTDPTVRTNFLLAAWEFELEPFEDVIIFAENITEPFYV